MEQSTGLIIHIPLNSFEVTNEVTNIQIGGKMKDKTIIFGIFYDIFAGLSILCSSEAGSKTEDKSSSSCCPPPSITLHYPHNQVFYCRDRPGYEQTGIRRYAKFSHCLENRALNEGWIRGVLLVALPTCNRSSIFRPRRL